MFLPDDKADKGGIFEALAAIDRNMTSSAGQDLAVVMFSGHGTMIDNQFYLVPYGAAGPGAARCLPLGGAYWWPFEFAASR